MPDKHSPDELAAELSRSQAAGQDMRQWWDEAHARHHSFWLTGSPGPAHWEYLGIADRIRPGAVVLNIGVGLGNCTRALHSRKCIVDVLDISPIAIEGVRRVIRRGYLPDQLHDVVSGSYDLAISHLVAQHMPSIELEHQIAHVIRGLRSDGIFAMQLLCPTERSIIPADSDLHAAKGGGMLHSLDQIRGMLDRAGGRLARSFELQDFGHSRWYGVHMTH